MQLMLIRSKAWVGKALQKFIRQFCQQHVVFSVIIIPNSIATTLIFGVISYTKIPRQEKSSWDSYFSLHLDTSML